MSLTCISCKLLFSVPELHHEHYKSDWHRYNLKRRIAELPPLTKEEFEERAAIFKANTEEKERLSLKCDSCNKRFSSENAMNNHLKSKKHMEMQTSDKSRSKSPAGGKKLVNDVNDTKSITKASDMAKISDEEWSDVDGDWESCDDEDVEDTMERVVVDTNDCLFCDNKSDSAETNVSHMMVTHSFFIPDIEYVSDLDGLIAVLAGKILIGHICLWCNGKGKGFRSVKSVRQHMIDKGHCKILREGDALLDYAAFYDYSASDIQTENFEADAVADILENSDFELVLPSGATVGHRSLALYYKQNLKPVSSDNEKKVKRILQQYKALGYIGCTGPAAVKKAKDIVFMQKIKSRYNLKLGMKNNKLQPHFRPQVMF